MVRIKCILLCAGYAVRLHPLTDNQPKALLSVGEKTILDHIMAKVEEVADIDEVVIITNDKFFDNFKSWQKSAHLNKKVKVVSDGSKDNSSRLGAVGDLNFAVEHLKTDDDIMVILGDNLFDFSLQDLMDHYNECNSNVVALYDIKENKAIAGKYGVAVIDADGKITEFEEKPSYPKTSLVSTGCYIFKRKSIRRLKEYAKERGGNDNPGDFMRWLLERDNIHSFVFNERWFDIGSFEALEEAYKIYGRGK